MLPLIKQALYVLKIFWVGNPVVLIFFKRTKKNKVIRLIYEIIRHSLLVTGTIMATESSVVV